MTATIYCTRRGYLRTLDFIVIGNFEPIVRLLVVGRHGFLSFLRSFDGPFAPVTGVAMGVILHPR